MAPSLVSPPSASADPLWARIAAHDFEAADQTPNFLQRLARDKAWTPAFARGAIAEYRRFAYLCVHATAPMTPSEEVDEVWHLHLTYSRDYWEVWCARVLRVPLHHDPSRGGQDQQRFFRDRYAETLAAYEARFGLPPETYWPATRRRFRGRPRFRGVDADRAMVWPKLWSPRFWRDLALSHRSGTPTR